MGVCFRGYFQIPRIIPPNIGCFNQAELDGIIQSGRRQ
nr:MAG TPA: hypothetical protein [Caudoviricetes sp.]